MSALEPPKGNLKVRKTNSGLNLLNTRNSHSQLIQGRNSPKHTSPDFFENLRKDKEVFKLISDCLPETQSTKQILVTPVKDNQGMKYNFIAPLTCVKEDKDEDEPS